MFIPSEITLRVLSVFDILITNGIANNQREFCKRIRMPYFSFAQVKRKERDFPDPYLENICDIYNVNPDYLIYGTKSLFRNNKQPVRNINEIKGASEASVKRIWIKDIDVMKSEDGTLIRYTDYAGEKHIIEFVNG